MNTQDTMNSMTQITSTFQFCPHICTYGWGNSKDSVPIFPATSSKVVGNGVIIILFMHPSTGVREMKQMAQCQSHLSKQP